VVLGWTNDFSQLRTPETRFLTFRSLTSPERVASGLHIPTSRVVDLEAKLPPYIEDSDVPDGTEFADERRRDADLEPFVPFGLLIQDYFDDLLSDDDLPSEPRAR
jgi:hypothetical protein